MADKKKPTLLLVDDSRFSLSQMSKALSEEFEVICANSGAEGLAQLEKNKVDLVVTDLLMPQISGLAFLGQVRHRYPKMKVIVCSADIQEATTKKAKRLGAAAFLGKPIDPDEFRRVIRLVGAHDVPPRELPIAPKYTDAFREIFNIGVGKAADALSKLVYDTVKLSVPQLEVLRPEQLKEHIATSFSDDIACVRQEFGGHADGRAYLVLGASSGLNLVNALVKQDTSKTTTMLEADREMLSEVGNILINSLVGTLANTLGVEFEFGQARCQVMSSRDIDEYLGLSEWEFVLYVETLFVVPGRQIGGNLAILLGSTGMGSIMKGIDRLL